MPAIGPRFRAQVHDAARELAPFCTLIVRLDFIFVDGVLGRNDDRQIDVAYIQGLTVEVLGTLVGERTSDLVIAPAEWVLAHRRAAGSSLSNRCRRDRNQVKDISSVQRQFIGLALIYHLTE